MEREGEKHSVMGNNCSLEERAGLAGLPGLLPSQDFLMSLCNLLTFDLDVS